MKNSIAQTVRYLIPAAVAVVLLSGEIAYSQVQESIPENVRKDWEALVGEWTTHDNTDGYDAYGMKFTWGLAKKTVDGILYAIRGDKNIGTLWEYKIYYHPLDKKIILEQYGSDGSFGTGEIVILDDLKSENISTLYNTDGSIFKLKHEQQIKGDVKTSQTFVIDESGQWVKARYYEWHRSKEGSD